MVEVICAQVKHGAVVQECLRQVLWGREGCYARCERVSDLLGGRLAMLGSGCRSMRVIASRGMRPHGE